mgnify:CR=1 FL=1
MSLPDIHELQDLQKQKRRQDIRVRSINDYLKSYQDVNINDYEFDLKTMENTSIPMEEIKWLTSTEEYKFIRA